ncbi:MAG: bifunctional (p)ppGpp synthetase/guanosine-3',5'-bis(diphosphate) 3'-pyrophosphohydrolase [Clostridiales bacterium]|nr:bifunctional (p)ppGpp synthetase/guanosine-3',5'-bis(diphosphate) 3'-pyrophosphohydrolase [Clostridiales bacterium]
MLQKAYDFAELAHRGQKRKSDEPYIVHPVAVAEMLAEMEMDIPTIVAGMLHDVIEDTKYDYNDIQKAFGKEVADLVEGVTKLKRIPYTTKEEQQAENLRKMFLSMANDIRVILIKLVDRLHNMRTLQYMNTDSQITKARETLEIYTPLAHRLGMTKIKWELEDLCFKYLEPEAYETLSNQITQKREQQEEYIKQILETIRVKTQEININAFLDGRPKHLYSIHKKMIRQNKTFDQIYDLIAVRVIVDTVQDCYAVLGLVHELYKPMPGRFKDYIAMPKPNMYQSLHTTLIGPEGIPFEVQIRTWEMHKMAEIGIAAHYRYKDGSKADKSLDNKLEWIRQLLDIQNDTSNASDFVETFKMNLFTDEVFVFTPKGDVKNLPADSIPIDFAYAIHSAIGNRMIGAKVNGEIAPLNTKLKNGDIVEIITGPESRGPSRDWLKIVKSSEAKNKIRQWFKKEKRDENIARGREMIERELKRIGGYTYSQIFRQEWVDVVLKKYNLANMDDLYNLVGFGEINAHRIVVKLRDEYVKTVKPEKDDIIPIKSDSKLDRASENGIIVKGIDNCLVRLSKCCNPVPGDSIVGYVTRGRGVSVHRSDCTNINFLSETEGRMIDVRWADQGDKNKTSASYNAELTVTAIDRPSLLLEIANVIDGCSLPVRALNARTTKDNYAILNLTVETSDKDELEKLTKKLFQVDNVVDVKR